MPYELHKWTQEQVDFLFEIKDSRTKKERYDRFKERFPDTDYSLLAVSYKASEVGAVRFKINKKARPLYTEREKKGYIQIKVAMPNTYIPKQKWVYLETHPWIYPLVEDTDVFIFLDGDNRNFAPDNIELLKRKEQTAFLHFGGVVKGNAELTRLHLAQARLKIAQLDVAEKIGDVKVYFCKGEYRRVVRKEMNRKAREYIRHKYATSEEYRQQTRK